MRTGLFLLTGLAVIGAGTNASVSARAAPGISLDGYVKLPDGVAAEGVIVSALKNGSTITTSVASDNRGYYSFPAAKLPAGHYSLSIRAIGYDLDKPRASDLTETGPVHADLNLRKIEDIQPQLTSAEWLMSAPGTEEDKSHILLCNGCHTYERIFMSTHDTTEFESLVTRMVGYSPGTFPLLPQVRPHATFDHPERFQTVASYLSTVNLSSGPRKYPLQTLPRPEGRATRIVFTEYQLPRPEIQPHDVALDREGHPWFVDFGEQLVGKLDPNSGKVTEYTVPTTKPGAPTGLLDIQFDKDDNPWFGMMLQAAIAKFDRKTNSFKTFLMPAAEVKEDTLQIPMIAPKHMDVDGKIWMDANSTHGFLGIQRMDVKTGAFELFDVYKVGGATAQGDAPRGAAGEGEPPARDFYGIKVPSHGTYDIATDTENNLYFSDFADTELSPIGRINAKTGKLDWFYIPTPHARPRRMFMDSHDQLWIAEFRSNKVAMFDTKTERFKEWNLPAGTYPYDVVADKNGEIWTGSEFNDRLVRLNPKTKETVAYLMPQSTDIRRMYVDNSTSPVTIWVGNNHAASILKAEPLD